MLVHSNHEDIAEIRLFKNKFEAATQEVRLVAGENRVLFTQTSTESGTLTFDALARSTQDTRYDNNRALGIVVVSGKPKVLLIDENEPQARYLTQALEDADIRVNVRNGLGVPDELADLQNYDLVVFADVPANRLTKKQMELIRTYVQDLGGGFMMLGRRDKIGVVAFDGSPFWIAEMHSASDKLYLSDQIGSITANGGTNLYPALEQAYLALTETNAKLKHVIVLSDGMSQPGDWYGMAS